MTTTIRVRRGWLAASAVSIGVPAALLLVVGVLGLLLGDRDASDYAVASIALALGASLAVTGAIEVARPKRWSFPALMLVTLLLFAVGAASLAGGGFYILPVAILAWVGLVLDSVARRRNAVWIAAMPLVLLVVLYALGQIIGVLS